MPHRLGPEEMEYTTLPSVLEKLKDRFFVEKVYEVKKPKVTTSLLTGKEAGD
jgi:fructose 1,6-bisphosphate aldolase/phosphatase